ncbi:N-acetyltransferase [Polymorphobacter fuscus]|uniref:N-acetyltransferase n=1 Tax=Sandarakinorhabdus fusca TaxID=1439888 RepID=A0A7C9LGS4_9SPHN|nr:N-acetyltransferase [Polymorphobacter fuscus]KAB7646446.1 N-acetyltransferase [Polymorphobacter fuscus]MQT17687.1 N-acetyltransferase [Polymorphobacter fuscus]NJC09768.1 GNAT superfamily N-acetyltransferase [Polymorphobacter fuscus]
MPGGLSITTVATAADRKAFVDLPYRLYAGDPHFVPPLRSEVHALIGGIKGNPWFEHGKAQLWLAHRDGKVVGRISAQVDRLVQEHVGAGTGHWGMFETIDDQAVADLLLQTAEDWLRSRGMTRAQGPFSLSIWDEPGLLVEGFSRAPTVMMGHHLPYYRRLIEAHGYVGIKDLHTWGLRIDQPFPEMVQRIVAASERNSRLVTRRVDKARFAEEAALILDILNDAWSTNWGFVPLTPAEVAFVGKKLKPIVFEDLIRIAEYDGVPVGFMISLPDINELTRDLGGDLFPFGWAKLLWRLRAPKVRTIRVPLMGIRKTLQGHRVASLMAFQMIEYIRRDAVAKFGATEGEIGWILDDNGPMRSIADAIDSKVTRTYRVFERGL